MTDAFLPTRRHALAAAGAFTLLLTGCAQTRHRTGAGPVRITHAQGETVLPALPQRVAVFDLAALDILQSLGADVVGVPAARFPDYLSAYAADKYPRIGTLFEPDYAAVRAARPDLIIVAGRSASKLAERACSLTRLIGSPASRTTTNANHHACNVLARAFTGIVPVWTTAHSCTHLCTVCMEMLR
ncbi:MAG: hypothetical protein EON92_19025 [Burkholderiales bacterium]|nr:MAG: hypothetical protein EON92_19025 [Burkholderiales bacterium]